jgi:NADP-dependent 3-hydroxy acid dehydrogenase YdfG
MKIWLLVFVLYHFPRSFVKGDEGMQKVPAGFMKIIPNDRKDWQTMKSPALAFSSKFDYLAESVQDKTVLVTGGTTGIGRTTALLLASQGAHVMIFGRHEKELNDALSDIKQVNKDHEVFGLQADVSNIKDIQRVFQQVDKQFKRLDILINNAALAYDTILTGSHADWQYIVNTNLIGYMACAREAVERMKKAKGGHIVNIGSMSANSRKGGDAVYVATKSGTQGFSESLGKEVAPMGIKVTLIEPGSVGTDMQEESPEEQRKLQKELKMLKAEDIAISVFYALTQPKRCDVTVIRIIQHIDEDQ